MDCVVTWPDDRLQQLHPASQQLQVSLQVLQHLRTNVLAKIKSGEVPASD